MTKLSLRIPGTPDAEATSLKLGGGAFKDIVRAKPAQRYRIEATRAADTSTALSANSDDVVELELEGGVRIWTTLGQLQQDFPGAFKRGAASDGYAVPLSLPIGAPSRGLGQWALKALRLIDVDLEGTAAAAIARKLESKLDPAPGLYRIARADAFGLSNAGQIAKDKALLIFIHGTGSNTRAGFGDLWHLPDDQRTAGDIGEEEKRTLREQLYARYGDQLYAFEHRTLTESPIENALALAEKLPDGARLHLVSHSRGGLVGELLCRGAFAAKREPFSSADIELFADGKTEDGKKIDRSRDREALKKLNSVLKQKKFSVDRFVRVACPARGTTLASGRLDRWLSIVVNLFGQIPGFDANPIYDFTTSLMLAVVKKRTDPSELPGLEAMMPRAPLIRMLNFVAEKNAADLSVVAGDVEGSSLLDRLKFLVTDWFYQQDHDLVVDTVSMSGGAPREPYAESAANNAAGAESAAKGAAGARKFFERGARVTHFRYFRNPESVRKLYAGLLRKDDDDAGFEPLAIDYQELSARSALKRSRAAAEARPVVFLVPGIMGSHLEVRGNRIWMDPLDLAAGGMASLRIDAKNVNAEAVMGSSYGKLVDFLGDTHEVITFPYDWRKPLADSADRLAAEISSKLGEAERNKQPVSVLAHSMGGLVTRTMIATRPEVWSRMGTHADSRLIMLGTPNGGSYSIPVMLTARDSMVRKLALLDLGHNQAELLEIIARFPGALQMLPVQTRWDFFDAAFWAKLAQDDHAGKDKPWSLPSTQALDAARAARKVLDASPLDARRMLYVAGCAEATAFDLDFADGEPVGKRLKFQATARGDGRVPWETGIPPGVRTWYMEATHGDLANEEEAFPALLELLRSGTTTRLSTVPPAVRGTQVRFDLPEAAEPPVLPDAEDLAASALGSSARTRTRQRKARINVAVLHGDLAFTANVVAVGHYEGDTIVSAEAYLDRRLDQKLSTHHQLGLYPGRPDTAEVFLNTERKPAGAIVIGLGQVGELTPGALTASFKRGVLMYAAEMAEQVAPNDGPRALTIGSLLIGTRAGGIGVDDAQFAILRGLAQAADALAATPYKDRIRIEGIEFIELYEDRAIQAARALLYASADTRFQAEFTFDAEVRSLPGRQGRVVLDEDRDWWRRLQILAAAGDALQFNTLTDRARVEVQLQATQRTLVDNFLNQAISTTRTDYELGSTLFELLVPNRLKDQAPNQEHVVLVLDEGAARYPWELLIDRRGSEAIPLCVQAGMIRQLQTPEFRATVASTTKDNVLVIGDPALGEAEKLFPRLDGAKREADLVAEQLGKNMQKVTHSSRQGSSEIVRALFADEYKILHLAGHGVYEFNMDEALGKTPAASSEKLPRVSGMVIGDGIYLTPAEVEQMRSVPEMVFINCCHLGRVEDMSEMAPAARRDRHKLAANLATQFVRMGVKAVVAAGWEVDDAAAATFAATFYAHMCDGMEFGEAVLEARKAVFDAHRSVNTWGAYQCYGDQAYRLRTSGGRRRQKPLAYVSAAEAVQDLHNILAKTPSASDKYLKSLLDDVNNIYKHIEQQHAAWLRQPELLAALGAAYGELDAFEQAIDCYGRAKQAQQANYPFKALEQLANLQARYAVQLVRGEKVPAAQRASAQKLLLESIKSIDKLLEFGATSERLSVQASAYKRKALVDKTRRKQALEKMVESYQRADALAREKTGQGDAYPRLNALAGRALLALLAGKSAAAHAAELEANDAGAERAASFWAWVQKADTLLIKGLIEGNLDAYLADIKAGYREAFERAAAPRERRSVRENIEFLIDILSDAPRNARNRQLLKQLNQILTSMVVDA